MNEQVLLATGGGNLVYIEIGQGTLVEVAHVQLEYEISCLDINPVGDNPERSNLVAVGMWTDISVRIFSLPSLSLITKEMLGGEIIPRSVLFCSFDGVSSTMWSNFLAEAIPGFQFLKKLYIFFHQSFSEGFLDESGVVYQSLYSLVLQFGHVHLYLCCKCTEFRSIELHCEFCYSSFRVPHVLIQGAVCSDRVPVVCFGRWTPLQLHAEPRDRRVV